MGFIPRVIALLAGVSSPAGAGGAVVVLATRGVVVIAVREGIKGKGTSG